MIKELKSSIKPGLLYAMLADMIYYGVIFALLLLFMPIFGEILVQVQQLSLMLNQLTPEMADNFISESSDVRFRMYSSICLVFVLVFLVNSLFKGLIWSILVGRVKGFVRLLLKFTLLNLGLGLSLLVLSAPFAALFFFIMKSLPLNIATVLILLLFLVYLPLGVLFIYFRNIAQPMLLKGKTFKKYFRFSVFKMHKFFVPYLVIIAVLAILFLGVKLISFTRVFFLLSSKGMALFWLLFFIFYITWAKSYLVVIIEKA